MHPARAYLIFSFGMGMATCFSATTYVPYLRTLGLTMADVTLINAVFWAVITIAEVPTGLLADARSRSWSIRAGILLLCLSSFAYVFFVKGIVTALVIELNSGIGFAFLSGAQTAWATDALDKRGESHRLQRTLSHSAMLRSAGALVGGVVGGWLGTVSLRLPFFIDGIVCFVLFIFVLCTMRSDGEPTERETERKALSASLLALKAQPALRWILVAGMLVGFVLPYNLGWAVYSRERFGAWSVSWIWAFLLLALIAGGYLSRNRSIAKSRLLHAISLSLGCMGVGMVVVGSTPSPMFFLVGVGMHEVSSGVYGVVSEVFVQERIGSSYRATFGSLNSLFSKLGYALVLGGATLLFGSSSDPAHIQGVWMVMGALLAASASSLWLFRPRLSS